jgi:hypothetical protein
VTRKAWRRLAFGRGATTWRGTVALCDVARAPHAMKEPVSGRQWADETLKPKNLKTLKPKKTTFAKASADKTLNQKPKKLKTLNHKTIVSPL